MLKFLAKINFISIPFTMTNEIYQIKKRKYYVDLESNNTKMLTKSNDC